MSNSSSSDIFSDFTSVGRTSSDGGWCQSLSAVQPQRLQVNRFRPVSQRTALSRLLERVRTTLIEPQDSQSTFEIELLTAARSQSTGST
jgi:hypothetical protein